MPIRDWEENGSYRKVLPKYGIVALKIVRPIAVPNTNVEIGRWLKSLLL
jgi:hypothetical protein